MKKISKAQQTFINNVVKVLRKVKTERVNDRHRTILLAQAILESGFGTSAICIESGNTNIFGTNYYEDSVCKGQDHFTHITQQYRDGHYVDSTEEFCKFKNLTDSVNFQIKWYTERSKYAGIWEKTASIPEICGILGRYYATGPNYAMSLQRVIDDYDCDSYFTVYFVSCGVWAVKTYADMMYQKLNTVGFYPEIMKLKDGTYRVYVKTYDYNKTSKSLDKYDVDHYLWFEKEVYNETKEKG